MENQRLTILRMLERGRLTAEEALRLLEALDAPGGSGRHRVRGAAPARRLRLSLVELDTGRSRAEAVLPASLVEFFLRLGLLGPGGTFRIAGQRLSGDLLLDALREGATGRILDVTDHDQNVRVEIFLE
ncbi:MAG: hypothetical protein K6U08_06185 [Firmicutes bacterium]|nr:hypothetical protein [Bacillota bacterium]